MMKVFKWFKRENFTSDALDWVFDQAASHTADASIASLGRHVSGIIARRALWIRKPNCSLMKITDHISRSMKEPRTMESRTTMLERYDVFLGGSCGGRKSPTTWRKEVAIPLLTKNDVTFFNPQVETWTRDLIVKENKAKENSDWLLFMLEASTRGIVSLVEVAYLVGINRSVIFVLQEERECGQLSIKEDTVSKLEKDDIVASQQVLNSIIGKNDQCRYFSVLEKGLNHVIDGLKMNTCVQTNGHSFSAKGGRRCQEVLQKLSNMFIRSQKPCDENGKRRRPSHLKILNPIQKYALGIVTADSAGNLVQMALDRLDSLSCSLSKDAVYVAQGSGPDVINSLSQSYFVLVVIPSTALGCAAMCKAAYLLSKCKNMAIHLEEVSPETVDNGNTLLTPSAVEDFNRARKYLKNMAANHGVPVYSSLTDAMQTAALKVKSRASMVHSVIAEH